MSGRLEFTIPGDPVKDLGGNEIRRLHWAEWGRRVTRWRVASWACWRDAGAVQFYQPVTITFTLRRGRKCDIDNAATSLKAAIDGLKGHLIPDDSPEWLTEVLTRLETGAEWKGHEEVLVTVEESNG